MFCKRRGINLIELIVAMVLMSLVILGFFSVELFCQYHVLSSDRRARLQNELSYSIEYMSKYVYQSIGSAGNPPITVYPVSGAQTGFRTRVDLNDPKTPGDLSDDTWVNFYLDGYQLKASQGASTEVLTSRVIANLAVAPMPGYPDSGLYVNITDQGTAVDIGLVGRYDPAVSSSADNPQIAIKTRLVSSSGSAQ